MCLLYWLCLVLRVVFDECCFVVCRFLLFGILGSGLWLLLFVVCFCLLFVVCCLRVLPVVCCVLSLFVVCRVLFCFVLLWVVCRCVCYWLRFVVLYPGWCCLLFVCNLLLVVLRLRVALFDYCVMLLVVVYVL